MNVAEFLGNFRVLVNAPDGVTNLRRMVLTLAVQGRLVPQSPDDQPASAFLAQIALGRDREFLPRPESSSFSPTTSQIPKSWCWARFEDVAEIQSNLVRPGDFPDVPHLAPDNIEKGTGVLLPCRSVREDKVRSANHRFFSGQIVYSKIRPNLSKVVIVDFDGLCSADMYPIKAFILPRYLFRYMLSEHFLMQSVKSDTRVAMPKINQSELNAIEVPVPPLEEQKRIVAKVDELMRLCDRLEAQQQEREKLLPLLSRANHTRFVASTSPASLRSIFHRPGGVSPDDMRHTILSLAVQGKLIPQDPNDASVIETLQDVVNPAEEFKADANDHLYSIPHGWSWFRVSSLFTVAGGIQKTPHRSPKGNAWPYLGVSNVHRGRIDVSNVKLFELQPGELERRRLEVDDLLIIEGNGSFNEIGRCAKWNGEIENCVHQNHVIRCRPCDRRLSDFVLLFLNSPNGIETMQRLAITSSGLYSLSVGKIRQIWIPIPPFEEQRRITSRVAQLIEILDRLEKVRHRRILTAESFAKAAVAAITSTEFMENERMKPPKTEVVTALKVGTKPKNAALAPLAALLATEISLAPPKAAASAHAKRELTAKELWQLSGLEIDAFYRQLKTEMANDWIKEDGKKRAVKEVEAQ